MPPSWSIRPIRGPQRVAVLRRVEAQHAHGAGIGPPVALEDLDGRGLAGAVGPEQGEQLAAADLERDAGEDLAGAVRLADVADADRDAVGGVERRAHGLIFAYWVSKTSAVIWPIWIARMTPSLSMKNVCGGAAIR